MPRILRRFLLVAVCLLVAGCVRLTPRAVVHRDVPATEFVSVAGQAVHVERQGSGAPIVLLHGFGESTFAWRAVVPTLARDYATVAIDLNGFGWTDRPADPGAYTLAGQAKLVLGVADALGLERFSIIGHSYGGGIALYLAARHPERVQALVLVDNTQPLWSSERRSPLFRSRWLSRVFARTLALTRGRVRSGLRSAFYDDGKVTPALVGEYLDRLRVQGAGDAFYGLSRPGGEAPFELDLATVRQPALVVWGENDTVIDPAVGRERAAKMSAARFVALADCGHAPMEECPGPLLAALLPFLAAGRAR